MPASHCRLYAACVCMVSGLLPGSGTAAEQTVPTASELSAMSARFAPVDIRVDLAALPAGERAVLAKLVEASRIVDALFMRQRSASNVAWLLELLNDNSPLGKARL